MYMGRAAGRTGPLGGCLRLSVAGRSWGPLCHIDKNALQCYNVLICNTILSTHSFTQRRKHYDQRTGRNGNGSIPHHLYCGAAAGCCAGRRRGVHQQLLQLLQLLGQNTPAGTASPGRCWRITANAPSWNTWAARSFRSPPSTARSTAFPVMELVQKLDGETLIDPKTGTA